MSLLDEITGRVIPPDPEEDKPTDVLAGVVKRTEPAPLQLAPLVPHPAPASTSPLASFSTNPAVPQTAEPPKNAEQPRASILDQVVDTVTTPSKIAPLLLRTASGFTGGGPLGAIVGALGETGAEAIENVAGRRQGFSPVEIAGESAIGAIPFGKYAEGTSTLGRIVREAGRGAAAVSLGEVAHEGRLPSTGELALGAGVGALAGGYSAYRHPSLPTAETPPLAEDLIKKPEQNLQASFGQTSRFATEIPETQIPYGEFMALPEESRRSILKSYNDTASRSYGREAIKIAGTDDPQGVVDFFRERAGIKFPVEVVKTNDMRVYGYIEGLRNVVAGNEDALRRRGVRIAINPAYVKTAEDQAGTLMHEFQHLEDALRGFQSLPIKKFPAVTAANAHLSLEDVLAQVKHAPHHEGYTDFEANFPQRPLDIAQPLEGQAREFTATNARPSILDDIMRTFAPSSRTEGAGRAHALLRGGQAKAALDVRLMRDTFEPVAQEFERLSQQPGFRDAFVDAYERGGSNATRELAPEFVPVMKQVENIYDQVYSVLKRQRADLGFHEFYLNRAFTAPEGEEAGIRASQFLRTSGAMGQERGFFKRRAFQFESEARAAGFTPIEQNPIRQFMHYVESAKDFEQQMLTFRNAENEGLITRVAPGGRPPPGTKPIQNRMVKLFDEHSGETRSYQYYASEPVARIFENALDYGISARPTYKALYGPATVINTFRVSLSAFHFTLTAINDLAHGLGVALNDLARGNISEGASGLAKSFTGARLWEDYRAGRDIVKSLPKLLKFSPLHEDFEKRIQLVLRGSGRFQEKSFSEVRGFVDAARSAMRSGQWGEGVENAIRAAETFMSYPLMGKFVPRVKMGAFLHEAERQMKLQRPATIEAETKMLQEIWDHVDDVFGQLVRDNLDFSKKMKDTLNLVIGFPGWNIGSARKILAATRGTLKAAVGQGRAFDERLAQQYWLGLTIQVAFMGSLLNYAMTGEWPSTIKDALYPRTGEQLPNGSPERVQLPSYIRDVVGLARHPLATIGHKQNPLLGTLVELADNMDYYGNQIRDQYSSYDQQALDVTKHVAKAFVPFSISGAMQSEGSTLAKTRNILGLNPPPAAITNTPAQQRLSELVAMRKPSGGYTREEERRFKERRDLITLGRKGSDEFRNRLSEDVAAGNLTHREAANIRRIVRQHPMESSFSRLPLDEAINVYELANDEERKTLRQVLIRRWRAASPAMKAEWRDRYTRLIGSGGGSTFGF